MNNSIKTFYFYNIKNALSHILFYLSAIIFSCVPAAFFFIKQQFFTSLGSTNLISFFSFIPYICILIIPSLCFKHNDNIYDDFVPINSFTKLCIKFFSILTLFTILILLLLIVPIIVSKYGFVDKGEVLISLLCLLFYGACEIALCLFFTELFENNIVSFLINAFILAIFNFSHLFSLYIPFNNFFVNFFKAISFAWHFDAAGKGVVDTRDFFFFIFLTIFFLLINDFIKQIKKGKVFNKNQNLSIVFSFSILILLLLNSNQFYTRLDFSKNKTHSISKYSKQLIKNAQENINITYYRSKTLSDFYPQIRDVTDFLTSVSSQNKNITFSIVDPDNNQQALNLLQNYGLTSQQMRSVKSSTSVEYINVYSAIIIEYNGNIETIPYILSSQTLEYDLIGRIKHLLTNQTRLVNIIVGNELSLYDSSGYNLVIPWLNAQGFICNPISIDSATFSSDLENTTGPLLIIGDKNILSEQAIAIENYILSKNQNALFTISPYNVDFSNWHINLNKNTNLVEMIENWGIIFKNQIAADITGTTITMESQAQSDNIFEQSNTYKEEISYPMFINILPQTNTNIGLTLFWPTPLELTSPNAKEYLISTPSSWTYEIDKLQSENLVETNPFYVRDQDISTKDKSTQILCAMLEGQLNGYFNVLSSQKSKIIVIPDQYFLSTLMNYGYIGGEYGDYRNFEFMTNCLLVLNDEEELALLQNKAQVNNNIINLTTEEEFLNNKKKTFIICFVIVPLIIIIIGFLLLIIKRKKLLQNSITYKK